MDNDYLHDHSCTICTSNDSPLDCLPPFPTQETKPTDPDWTDKWAKERWSIRPVWDCCHPLPHHLHSNTHTTTHITPSQPFATCTQYTPTMTQTWPRLTFFILANYVYLHRGDSYCTWAIIQPSHFSHHHYSNALTNTPACTQSVHNHPHPETMFRQLSNPKYTMTTQSTHGNVCEKWYIHLTKSRLEDKLTNMLMKRAHTQLGGGGDVSMMQCTDNSCRPDPLQSDR